MTRQLTRQMIKSLAIEAGFALVGITGAEPLDARTHLEQAVDAGRIAEMKYLGRDVDRRCDPRALFPEARSVICLAMPYPPETKTRSPKVARFARGEDYHELARTKMRLLWDEILKLRPEAHAKFCVDTSPILEKALAERAGIGWIGKNSILLNEELGSWFALCEIITDIELETDAPATNKCENCTKCIEACPTEAISAPFTVDSRRCISYWTATAKTQPPYEIAEYVPEGAHGCDICQLVCPFNAAKQP